MNIRSVYCATQEEFMKHRKRFTLAIALVALATSFASCTLVNKALPPGQAKKLTGQQSASELAPGKK